MLGEEETGATNDIRTSEWIDNESTRLTIFADWILYKCFTLLVRTEQNWAIRFACLLSVYLLSRR